MRDVGKVRNKFELKLDSNQVFFLFAGLAAYSALIFVLGVVVGRSRRPEMPVAAHSMSLPNTHPEGSGGGDVKRVEDRLAAAQPAATEEPELPMGFYENLENGTPVPTRKPASIRTPAPTPARTASPPAGDTATAPPPSNATGAYTLQIVAYNEIAQAEKAVTTLKGNGFDAYTLTTQIPGKGTIHRVRIGRYASRADAESAADSLSGFDAGMKPIVMQFE